MGSDKARLSEGRSWTNTMLVENLLSYNKIINNHNISGIFAYTSQAFKENGLSVNLMHFDVESVHAPDNAQETLAHFLPLVAQLVIQIEVLRRLIMLIDRKYYAYFKNKRSLST